MAVQYFITYGTLRLLNIDVYMILMSCLVHLSLGACQHLVVLHTLVTYTMCHALYHVLDTSRRFCIMCFVLYMHMRHTETSEFKSSL